MHDKGALSPMTEPGVHARLRYARQRRNDNALGAHMTGGLGCAQQGCADDQGIMSR